MGEHARFVSVWESGGVVRPFRVIGRAGMLESWL